MVESALEFARIARERGFHQFVFSMKASNPKVMIAAYRLLAARLDSLGPDWNYPLHLGVTEAGDGEDGRIKSAIGIGSLLADGIGDTIRVSLTEDSVHEIPVAQALAAQIGVDAVLPGPGLLNGDEPEPETPFDAFSFQRRSSATLRLSGFDLGEHSLIRLALPRAQHEALLERQRSGDSLGEYQPELTFEALPVIEIDPRDAAAVDTLNQRADVCLVTVADLPELPPVQAFRLLAARVQTRHPILLKDTLNHGGTPSDAAAPLQALLRSSAVLGSLICDGIGDAILVRNESAPGAAARLGYNILQAAGARIFKTDYVACPSCGRTLFNLQETTAKIKAATAHLKGVKIAIMGCIVNGPGEMADADFGYVGGAPGKINLYVGKTPVKFNIPEAEAVARLRDLIAEHGKWVDPV
jgi:(E)-4-hydroxy-3-methylbut-2-enyl-diphosphate synthase